MLRSEVATLRFEFDPFRLDPVERVLRREGIEVRLTPKVLDLLLVLVRRHGHLLDKEALMAALWPGQVVEEANLTQTVAMLRKALGDRARAPRYVETRARRGYRFIADVRECRDPTVHPAATASVGRAWERAELRAELAAAAAGSGRLVCVTGEPGIGKTTLVEDFLADLVQDGDGASMVRGRCSQRLAGTGAYLPWLDALDDLLRHGVHDDIAPAMRRMAPTWYAQVAGPAAAAGEGTAGGGTRATSQELMMRELAGFVEETSIQRPLVLFLDDLHWADGSSVDVLAYLATRLTAARVLIVVAYRPSELLLARHPFLAVKQELDVRGRCRTVDVPFLSRVEVEQYLDRVFPGHRFPATVPAWVHARTEGNPLFMADLVRHLQEHRVIARDAAGGSWALDETAAGIACGLPGSVRSLIERKISQLEPGDRTLLAAASVQGEALDSLVVARALGLDPPDVEERLGELERAHAFVRRIGEDLAGAAPTVRYRFVHVLYQDSLAGSLAPSRRTRLSGAIAEALLEMRSADDEIAPELAHLYEAAGQRAQAADWYGRAAERAAALFAHGEAAALARRGLQALMRLAESPHRARLELRLQAMLGVALSVTSGYAAADTGSSLTRAYGLCRLVDDAPQLFPAIWRLWVYYAAGAQSRPALTLADRLLAMAKRSRDPGRLVAAHFAVGNTLHLLGKLVAGSRHLERGVALHDPRRCRFSVTLYSCDPGLYCRSHSARTLWLVGHPDRARRRSHETIVLARAVGDPRSLAHVLMFAAICHQLRREAGTVEEHGAACAAVSEAHGVADEARRVAVLLGWARAVAGQPGEGIAQITESLAALRAMRSINTLPYYLALLAEALDHGGRPDDALSVVDQGLSEVRRTGERFYEAELHRLRGELLLRTGARQAAGRAEAAFGRALGVARAQRATGLELRAMTSLARLWHARGRGHDGRDALARVCGRFTEGIETADVREGRALLATLERASGRARRAVRRSSA